jgi:hypothetical protein
MARQDTKCIAPSELRSWGLHLLAGVATAGVVGALIGVGMGGGPAVAAVALILAPLGGMVAFCDWFFNYRLVCITDDEVAAGTVNRTDVWFDGDYTFDMILAPFRAGATLDELQAGPQGRLMQHHHPPLGYEPDLAGPPASGTPIMHNEIEGTRMKAVCIGGTVGAALGVPAGIATFAACCAALCWTIIGALVCIAAGFVAAGATTAAGVGIGYAVGGEATPSEAGENRAIRQGDCIAVRGRFIYDAGHEGWNEIHAVMRVVKLEPSDCETLDGERIEEITELLVMADDIDTRQQQLKEQNRFLTHRMMG